MEHINLIRLSDDLAHIIDKEEFSDVRAFLGVNRKVVWINSVILKMRSPVFAKMFTCEMSEKQNKEWIIPDADVEHFLVFLRYLYTGKVSITVGNVMELSDLSDKYMVADLYLACQKFLISDSIGSWMFVILEKAAARNMRVVINHCLKVIDANPLIYLAQTTTEKGLHLVLARDSLNMREIELFEFLLKWSEHDKERIRPFLKYVRLHLMSAWELIMIVKPTGLFSCDQYTEALEYNADKRAFLKTHQDITPRSCSAYVDYFLPSPGYSLENNGVVTKTDNSTNSLCVTNPVSSGIWRWTIKLNESYQSDIYVGIDHYVIDKPRASVNLDNGWYLWLQKGMLRSGKPHSYYSQQYLQKHDGVTDGDVVDVELSIPLRCISFSVNSQNYSVAYQNLPSSDQFRLAIIMNDKFDVIELRSARRF